MTHGALASAPPDVVGHIPSPPTVVGTGLVALDVIYGLDEACAPRLFAGGTCGNVMTALAFLGWASYPVARIEQDAAGARVLADLASCGVRTDFVALAPRRPTPVIVQRIRVNSEGQLVHRFSTRCPGCGGFFPQYQPVPREPMAIVVDAMPAPNVVFLDRVSPAAALLAEAAYLRGSLIYFEPSAKSDARLVERIMAVAHVLKYSADRAHHFDRPRQPVVPLEIETLGAAGLRYRGTMFGAKGRAWRTLPSFVIPQLRDAAGAGDWMTAGFIDFLAHAGAAGFEGVPRDLVEEGLRTGQAYSAWTCGFEGARGGMYRQSVQDVRDVVVRTLAAGAAGDAPTGAMCDAPLDIFEELCGGCGSTTTGRIARGA
ncbi:carbohydrate kinase family protein [Gemmatimonas aurantiaca]|uniref:carbohydrate kinase family protein n=1 Tax=Gemmatimonas aurantiaca TaxID=173480 RepID=UPI00301B7C60